MLNYVTLSNPSFAGINELLTNISNGVHYDEAGYKHRGIYDSDIDMLVKVFRDLIPKSRGTNLAMNPVSAERIKFKIEEPMPSLLGELEMAGMDAPIDPKDPIVMEKPLLPSIHINAGKGGSIYAETRISSLFHQVKPFPFKVVYAIKSISDLREGYLNLVPKRFVIRDDRDVMPKKMFYDTDQAIIDLYALTKPTLSMSQLYNLHRANQAVTQRSRTLP